MSPVKEREGARLSFSSAAARLPYAVGTLLILVVPLFLAPYIQGLMGKVLIYGIFAMSLNLIYGYTGLLSLGHAAYLGLGSYTVSILFLHLGVKSFWIAAPAGIIVASLAAAVFGLIALRVSGLYFLMITFALGELLVSVAVRWYRVTGGAFGLAGIERPDLGFHWFEWTSTSFYYFLTFIFIICYFLLSRLIKSPFGYALRGVRERDIRMRALGYNSWLFKYIAFIVSGAFAGLAGVLLAYSYGLSAPSQIGVLNSAMAMLMVIIGGAGTTFGPVIGAALLVLMEFVVSSLTPARWPLILGAVFVVSAVGLRGGVGAYLARFWKEVVARFGNAKG